MDSYLACLSGYRRFDSQAVTDELNLLADSEERHPEHGEQPCADSCEDKC